MIGHLLAQHDLNLLLPLQKHFFSVPIHSPEQVSWEDQGIMSCAGRREPLILWSKDYKGKFL